MLIDNSDFREQVRKDLTIIQEKFENECLDFSTMKQRYINLIANKTKLLKAKEEEKTKIYRKRYDYYKHEYKHVLDSSESKKYTESDDEYLKVVREYNEIECDIKYMDKILENIKDKYWMMNLFVEYNKFIKGER